MPKTSTKVDIVILSLSSTDKLRTMTQKSIDSLHGSEKDIRFNVVVIESNRDIKPFKFRGAETIYPSKSIQFGYNKFANIGISKGSEKYVAICNNDLEYFNRWASILIKSIESGVIRSASPWCPKCHDKLWKYKHKPGQIDIGYAVRRNIAGWCIFAERSVFNEIGKLDERGIFWYADNYYADSLREHNIKHGLVHDSKVLHFKNMTLNTLSRDTQARLKKKR